MNNIPENIKFETREEVKEILERLGKDLNRLCSLIRKNLVPTERNVIIHSIVAQSSAEVERFGFFYNKQTPKELLAWISRNLFELNVVLRYALKNEDNVLKFRNQLASDQIEVLEGILEISENPTDEMVFSTKSRIEDLKKLIQPTIERGRLPRNLSSMAKEVGLLREYKAFYKLYSKYVHPSAYLLLAAPDATQSFETESIFLTNMQIYAWDTYLRASKGLGIKINHE